MVSLECKFCKLVFTSVNQYVKHHDVHFSTKHFRIPCVFPSCHSSFKNGNAFSLHLSRHHSSPLAPDSTSSNSSAMMTLFTCSLTSCKEELSNRKQYLSHCVRHIECGIAVNCVWCSKTFNNTRKFRQHASAYHRDESCPPPSTAASTSTGEPAAGQPLIPEEMEDNMVQDWSFLDRHEDDPLEDSGEETEDLYPQHLVEDEVAKYYLMLEGSLLLPATTVQRISEENARLSRLSHHCLKRSLKIELKKLNIPDTTIDSIIEATFVQDPVHNLHHKGQGVHALTSTHLRSKYFSTHFPMVQPKEVKLEKDDVGNYRVAHYAPIKNILKTVLSDSKVKQLVEKSFTMDSSSMPSNNKIFKDYTDGEAFHQHKDQCRSSKCIQLILFQDAFEFHAFGAAKGLYKVNATYFTIGNLPPEYRSKVDSIHCAYLVKETDIKAVGNEIAFSSLIDELRELKDGGITFNDETLPVCLMFMTADNLGAHLIGGFVSSFSSANYICRFCETTLTDFKQTPFHCKPLRTVESYNKCLSDLKELNREELRRIQVTRQRKVSRSLLMQARKVAQRSSAPYKKDANQQARMLKRKRRLVNPVKKSGPKLTTHVRGVKEDSVLNKVPGYHVCSPAGLPPCLGHDLFEKIANVVLGRVLGHCIEEKHWFSFDTLNRRIKSFVCRGPDKQDAPVPLKSYEKVEGHACETWTLLRLLPFIAEGLISDPTDEVWQLYLLLKELTEYICAPKITMSQIAYMKRLIEDFVVRLKTLFPDCLYPKLHYIVHYPDLTCLFGPLIRLWTMRFESKHRFFKAAGIACKNFKNITFTLMNKYQLRFAYDHCNSFLCEDLVYDGNKIITNFPTDFPQDIRKEVEEKVSTGKVFSITKVVFKGVTYEHGLWLPIKKIDVSDLEMGCIENIFIYEEKPHFLLRCEVAKNSYCGYYEILPSSSSSYILRNIEELPDYYPLSSYPLGNGHHAFSLKHSILFM